MTKYTRKLSEKFSHVTQPHISVDDISRFYSDAHIVNKPFFFHGKNKKGVLLLHGWSSTPYELRALGEYLNRAGYTVYAPILSGHGTQPEDLEGVMWTQWLSDVEDAYAGMQECCDEIYIAGMSFGGTLSLHLAQKYADIAGLILMGTPYKMRYETVGEKTARFLKLFMKYKKKVYPTVLGMSSPGIAPLITYQRYPLESALQACECIRASVANLHRVTQPCLIMQSSSDHLITRDSAELLHRSIKSQRKEKYILHNVYHNFISGNQHKHVHKNILNFLARN